MQNLNHPIRIAIAEDNDALAQGICDKIALFSEELQFVFRGCDGKDLCKKLETESNIDIILMDIEMPEMDGIEATRTVREKYPKIGVIMLTVFDDEDKIFRSIQAGANGYLLKEESPESIRNGIFDILSGGAPMSPAIAAKALELLRNQLRKAPANEQAGVLSVRETEVLELISQGLDYKKIAVNLFISPATVRKHIENIYKKLQVNNKMKAVEKARNRQII